ncbi:hypothetical protein QWM81_01065 [Streptomyces ficellus]|uniref:Uncharacterized protein n=1 Tax=Streptomyces ficellus TaxID=1977088 RepID=A0ABT7YZI8_9ACTN|nr:hypothetical protein [Streptomyces ficellus]MDN3292655.1 hypothetical protein [Streptomyces ficellus]
MTTECEVPSGRERPGVLTAVALLEEAAAGLPRVPDSHPGHVSLGEEVCDRLLDLAAARAWLRVTAAASPDATDDVMHGCVRWAVQEDVVRTRADAMGAEGTQPVREGHPVDSAHQLVTRLITSLADAAYYDKVCARLRTVLGRRPDGRAAAAWDIADEALRGLGATRGEWVGGDPAFTAAGGWVLVDRIGRLQLAAALLSEVANLPEAEGLLCINAARRYTWNWLRQPPPEAATEIHVRRTGELVRWIRSAAPSAQVTTA